MILNLYRILIGFDWEWETLRITIFRDGEMIILKCKKTGRIKKVWTGESFFDFLK